MALYRVSSPLRLADRSSGLTADGGPGRIDLHALPLGCEGRVCRPLASRFAGRAGRVRVELVSKGSTVAHRAWIARSDSEKTFRFRAPPAPFSVRIQVAPTFSPSQFGIADTRQLGVRAKIRALPQMTNKARTLLGKGRRRIRRTFSTDEERGVTAEHWGEDAREKAESEDWQGLYWQSYILTAQHINRDISAIRRSTG